MPAGVKRTYASGCLWRIRNYNRHIQHSCGNGDSSGQYADGNDYYRQQRQLCFQSSQPDD